MDVVQISQNLSYKVYSIFLPKFATFVLFVLALGLYPPLYSEQLVAMLWRHEKFVCISLLPLQEQFSGENIPISADDDRSNLTSLCSWYSCLDLEAVRKPGVTDYEICLYGVSHKKYRRLINNRIIAFCLILSLI